MPYGQLATALASSSYSPARTKRALWRQEIVRARIRLADDDLSPLQRQELWQVVDCREWFLNQTVADFPAELELIDREIEDALRR